MCLDSWVCVNNTSDNFITNIKVCLKRKHYIYNRLFYIITMQQKLSCNTLCFLVLRDNSNYLVMHYALGSYLTPSSPLLSQPVTSTYTLSQITSCFKLLRPRLTFMFVLYKSIKYTSIKGHFLKIFLNIHVMPFIFVRFDIG